MTEVDKVFQIAARRIQGLTAKVNHWKQRANELEAALGTEKAARIVPPTHYDELQEELNKERSAHAESCRYLAESDAKAREWGTENKRLRGEFANLRLTFDAVHSALGIESGEDIFKAIEEHNEELAELLNDRKRLNTELNLVKQERDCAKSEWDRAEDQCKALVKDIEALRIELRKSQKEAVTDRQDAASREAEPAKVVRSEGCIDWPLSCIEIVDAK